jgi:hypothetical protein
VVVHADGCGVHPRELEASSLKERPDRDRRVVGRFEIELVQLMFPPDAVRILSLAARDDRRRHPSGLYSLKYY